MSLLLHGDCLDHMKGIDDNSVDFIFCDLPYGQTSCKWDCPIDLDKFWIEVMRIKKINTPIFMTTTTKFGVSLINSAPKKCPFRYDLVWVKSAPAGFLSAKKMPMRKHEMVYVFYEKLPFYDLSSHTHKFLKEGKKSEGDKGNECYGKFKYYNNGEKGYDPPLPVSVIKGENNTYNTEGRKKPITREPPNKYEPPLPTSVVKEECKIVKRTDEGCNGLYGKEENKVFIYDKDGKLRNSEPRYEPPLPTSVVKEDLYGQTCDDKNNYEESVGMNKKERKEVRYEPPLPTTMLEIKSTRGKHSTEKPVALMEWLLKYYSKEGDVVLDPTMGSGSTGVACKNMNRNFIGIEKDPEIYEVAVNRID